MDTRKAIFPHCVYDPMSPKTTNPRDPRVEIDPIIYRALTAEAILQDTTPKALVAKWIMDNLSPKTHEFIAPKDHSPMIPTPPKTIESQQQKKKEGRLVDNLEAIAKIREMWNGGCKNTAEIAREIGYPRATVNENIRKMKKKGDLKE